MSAAVVGKQREGWSACPVAIRWSTLELSRVGQISRPSTPTGWQSRVRSNRAKEILQRARKSGVGQSEVAKVRLTRGRPWPDRRYLGHTASLDNQPRQKCPQTSPRAGVLQPPVLRTVSARRPPPVSTVRRRRTRLRTRRVRRRVPPKVRPQRPYARAPVLAP